MSEKRSFKMAKEYGNFMSLETEKYHYEPVEMHFGIPWKIGVYIEPTRIWLYLKCDGEPRITEWAIHTSIKIYLTKNTGEEDIFTEKRIYYSQDSTCNNNIKNFRISDFSKYIVNGNVKVRYEVGIEKIEGIEVTLRNFDHDVAKKFSDVVLMAGDRNFYVNRMYLSSHSTYFESLFRGKFAESGESEIELKDIDPDDFQSFLEVLYGESAINEYTVKGILKLADMYDAKTAIRRCEEFLLEKSKNSMKFKFTLAVRYKLDALKKKCLSELKTTAEIRELIPENAHDFGPDVWKELFLKAYTSQ
ncbi:unnamed protein product [Caenorhabditis nigoni]